MILPIRAGLEDEVNKDSGEWVFIDIGFSNKKKTCGFLIGDELPRELTFADLKKEVLKLVLADTNKPLNLLIEAPLSVTFDKQGNPVGRKFEKHLNQTRYWYVGLGCSVLTATTYLLREIVDSKPSRNICLFEGFVSFKSKDTKTSHANDVSKLRDVIWKKDKTNSQILPLSSFKNDKSHSLSSAFLVAGMDFGVPVVVKVGSN